METILRKPGRPKKQPSPPQFHQITVHLPVALVSALDSELEPLGMRSRSELIRAACQNYLEQRKGQAQSLSLTRRLRDMPKEERQKLMAAAAESAAEYYRTDPEILEWHALDGEDFYDVGD